MEAELSPCPDAVFIDAFSQIFRVYFAIMHLSRKRDGFPTNALLGFGRLLLEIERDYAPKAGALFFDCGKPAFRLELAPGYKSNRPPMPEDLQKQMPVLREMIDAFGWQQHQCENFEADDLIGAAVWHAPQKAKAVISADKDLVQLITEECFMLIPAHSGGGFERRDAAKAVERFAVTPAQMVDYLSLLGDSADVIEGVAGIGPKTAASILNTCGSLDAFFAAPEKIANEKLRAKLLAAREQLARNRKLITLRSDWPEEVLGSLEKALVKQAPDWPRIAALFREYDLNSLVKQLPDMVSAPPPAEPDLFSAPVPAPKKPEPPVCDDLFAGMDLK